MSQIPCQMSDVQSAGNLCRRACCYAQIMGSRQNAQCDLRPHSMSAIVLTVIGVPDTRWIDAKKKLEAVRIDLTIALSWRSVSLG